MNTLGFWPFDSEREDNIDDAVSRAASLLAGRVDDKFTLAQKFRVSIGGVPFANDYGRFIRDYMSVAKSLKRPYVNKSEFYTIWEPALAGYGWAKDISEVMMTGMRELITQNAIEGYIANPGKVSAPGSTDNPLENAVSTGVKWLFVAGVIVVLANTLPTALARGVKAYRS